MDCQTATLLIEAYHDDELELVDAAQLLAHLEHCTACQGRCDESARLRDTLRAGRPVDRCPEELARRLARRVDVPGRPRRLRLVPVVVVFAGGCGLAVGWAAARAFPGEVRAERLAVTPRTFDADVFCLRCALRNLFPSVDADGGTHRPLLRTADGRLWVVRPDSPARARLAPSGPQPRHVVVTAALDERSGVADVTGVSDVSAAPAAAR
jgi:hypothetical protein